METGPNISSGVLNRDIRYSNDGHIYHDLYDNAEERPKSSFFFRLTLGVLCFVCYVWIDYGKVNVANVSSDKIVNQIEKQMDLKDIQAVWKKL